MTAGPLDLPRDLLEASLAPAPVLGASPSQMHLNRETMRRAGQALDIDAMAWGLGSTDAPRTMVLIRRLRASGVEEAVVARAKTWIDARHAPDPA